MKKDNVPVKPGRTKKIVLAVAAVVIVCAAIFGVLWAMNIGNNSGDGDGQKPEIPTGGKVTASDEETLRKLLLEDTELTIQVTDDMEVETGFIVNGTKTLEGTAELRMFLGAELGQAVLAVSEEASLTVDGLVLNGNFNADGIHMESNAELTFLSGTIKYAGGYGIQADGNVALKNVSIEGCEFISIYAQKGSTVDIDGASVLQSSTDALYVADGAKVTVSGETVIEGAGEVAVINYGDLEIHGGRFGDVNSYIFNNFGTLTVSRTGTNTIECYGARLGVFCTRKDAVSNISGAFVHDTARQAVVTVGGITTVKDCQFRNTGYHSIEVQAGEAAVENVTVEDSKASGLEAYTDAVVRLKGVTVTGSEGIGIASRGAQISGTDITVTNTGTRGITCGDSAKGQGSLNLSNVVLKRNVASSIYVYQGGEAELTDVQISDGDSRGIYVADNSSCTLSGNSSIQNMGYRGAEIRGKFVMNDGAISGNHVTNSGAGVYVANGGDFIMNGGAIFDNSSASRGGGICVTDGKVTINGGKVYRNISVEHGGGMYAQKETEVMLNNGEISDNKSAANGDGIYIASAATKVTVGENFYLGRNDVKLENTEAVLMIAGNGPKRHSVSDPLLLTPKYSATEGTRVASCENANVAKTLAKSVRSGDGSYNIRQNEKYFEIEYASADMDMTGADTVYVSNFEELEAAVQNTVSKRYIVLKADIAMERRLRMPGGVTICITDDGTKRTLTRANGFADNFFVTHYGTGLFLVGTEQGKLVLDGATTGVDGTTIQPLVRVAGSTVLRGMVLQNNVSVAEGTDVRGALLRQLYGDFKIYDSVLTGARSNSGGALMLDRGTGYIEGSAFTNNESIIGGGAIRVAGGSTLDVVSSVFDRNHAGSTGGAIVAVGKSTVTVTDTTFTNNTAESFGGAISAQEEGTYVFLKGNNETEASFENNSSKTIGAVCVQQKAQLYVSGYIFEGNKATGEKARAGAIAVNKEASATIVNTGFYKNEATGSGGALSTDGGTVNVVSCEFGKENGGNVSGDKGGAILVNGNGTLNVSLTENGVYHGFYYNTAVVGGAIDVYSGTAVVTGYIFKGNTATYRGGALYVEKGMELISSSCEFSENMSANDGGAVYAAGAFTDAGSSFKVNKGRNGGALTIPTGGTAKLNGSGSFSGNCSTGPGGAVYVERDAAVEAVGYTFEENQGNGGGALYVFTGAAAVCTNTKFTGNVSKNSQDAYANGGAVLCLGTFTDTDSSYTGNEGRNGGAIIIQDGGAAVLTGTSDSAKFCNNTASVKGGAIFANTNGSIAVSGYAFEDNASASANKEGIQINSGKGVTASFKDITFGGTTGKKLCVNGYVSFDHVTGVTFVNEAKAALTVDGYASDNEVEITPYAYTAGETVIHKGENLSPDEFKLACSAITLTLPANGSKWTIGEDGKLVSGSSAASVTWNQETTYYNTLEEAVAFANEKGGTGETADVVITVLQDAALVDTINITANVTFQNDTGKTVTISRGTMDAAKNMFEVTQGRVTIGTNDTNETGALIVDGVSEAAAAGRTVVVQKEGAFTLGANAALQNAYSSSQGAAMANYGMAYLYGTIRDNRSRNQGGAVYAYANSITIIDKCTFSGNTGATGGVFYIAAKATVTSSNAIFKGNTSINPSNAYNNGGAVYCAGTFTDTDSSYIDNTGNNGGALIVMSGGVATLTGTGPAAKFEGNKANVNNGGAIFVNGGGSASVTGYVFADNTGKANEGGVQVQKNGKAALADITFTGATGNKVYVNGDVRMRNVTGVIFVVAENVILTVDGYASANKVELTPNVYTEEAVVLKKAAGLEDSVFQAACAGITVTPKSDGTAWYIDTQGKLQRR